MTDETVSYWVDLTFACGGVEVRNGVIVETMPVLRTFVGQPFENLLRWSKTREVRRLDEVEE